MPFVNRGWLPARLAALLLLGSAVAGCQSTPIYRGHLLSPDLEAPGERQIVPATAIAPVVLPPINTTQAYAVSPTPATTPTPPAPSAQPVGPVQVHTQFQPVPTAQQTRGFLTWFRRPTQQEPPRLSPVPTPASQPTQAAPCVGPGCQSAMMLRPVTESTFTPVQRVQSPDSLPVTFVPATRPGDSGISITRADEKIPAPKTEKDKEKEKEAKAANNRRPSTLMMPREVKQPQGLPELPTPTVTNPPAAPREFAKRALSDYVIEPPDVLQIDLGPGVGDPKFPIRGTHLVRPDGTIGLGPLGNVFVAGLTLDQAKQRIAHVITTGLFEEKQYYDKFRQVTQGLKVDVAAFNSKFYYVIADGGGYGEQVYRVLCTGNETVLDAISQVEGLPRVASKKRIWLARATPTGVAQPHVLPVDWIAITQLGAAATNYQIYPGDRLYIESDPLIRADSFLAKVISPVERLFGITLLGSTTVNSIRNANNNNGGGGIR